MSEINVFAGQFHFWET